MNPVEEQMMKGDEAQDIAGLKQILESNDIEEIHRIAEGLLASEQTEVQEEQPKKSFVDKMVDMHKEVKENEVNE